jgi:hypothetical protein
MAAVGIQVRPESCSDGPERCPRSVGLVGSGVWVWGQVMGCRWRHDPHVVNTARARAIQNGFLNTQKRRKRSFHAVTSLSRVHCVGAQRLGLWEGGSACSWWPFVALQAAGRCGYPRDMAVEWPLMEEFLKVENATSEFLATCLLLVATALGQVRRCRPDAHL